MSQFNLHSLITKYNQYNLYTIGTNWIEKVLHLNIFSSELLCSIFIYVIMSDFLF